jgi:hypothetical protein
MNNLINNNLNNNQINYFNNNSLNEDVNIVEFHFIINNRNIDLDLNLNLIQELNNLFSTENLDILENVENGLKDKTKALKKINDSDTIKLNIDKCSICYSLFETKNNIVKTYCNHYFCDYCINIWLDKSKKCPCCMYDFDLI